MAAALHTLSNCEDDVDTGKRVEKHAHDGSDHHKPGGCATSGKGAVGARALVARAVSARYQHQAP